MKNHLDHIDKTSLPFEVPEGYFDQLPNRISEKVSQAPTATHAAFRWALLPAFVVTALVCLVILNTANKPDRSADLLASLTNEEIFFYLENTEISEYEIAALSAEPEALLRGVDIIDQMDLDEDDFNQLMEHYDSNDISQDI
ncbi:hypothetical protein [Marinoscillum sp. 108]|uniref:hypothetical protein n=1 Tax=Marinoscillum sp. 108 TaxID=2653151 RepID=UPI0012F1CD50|nr:hypothetical protein [Marinoscillum sp. 108]VXD12231.1 conserved hypothetical protein [Marinoscillum sp. 108]